MGDKVTFQGKEFIYVKQDEISEFVCSKCKKKKTSKKYAEAIDEVVPERICNGCFGYLIANRTNQD